jgi:RNA polymerase sigma-70 factor (ECF subfamily)
MVDRTRPPTTDRKLAANASDQPITQQADQSPSTRAMIVEELPRLRRYARRLAGDPDRADDLVHDCLVRALDRLDSYRPGTNLRAWLFVILRNCLYDEFRRSKRRPVVGEEITEDVLPRVSGGQEDRVILDEVDRAFARLGDDHQQILHLVAIEGRRYEDAADSLDIPVGTVRSRLSRARDALKEALDSGV